MGFGTAGITDTKEVFQIARKKKIEAETFVAKFNNGDKAVMVNGRLIRNGETVTAEEYASLLKLGVVNE